MNAFERSHIEAFRKNLSSLEEIIGRLHSLTLEMPHDEARNQVRDEVSCLYSVGDVMRQALDVLKGRWNENPSK